MAHQPQIGLVDHRGCIQRVARPFGSHESDSEVPQLVIHERKEFGSRLAVSGCGGVDEAL
jgi:hypothetical protein